MKDHVLELTVEVSLALSVAYALFAFKGFFTYSLLVSLILASPLILLAGYQIILLLVRMLFWFIFRQIGYADDTD